MLNSLESSVLVAIQKAGKRNGFFPPTLSQIETSFSDDKDCFLDALATLEDKGYIRVAMGRSKGLIITKSGIELAESLININNVYIEDMIYVQS